jgi:hypothetical protein
LTRVTDLDRSWHDMAAATTAAVEAFAAVDEVFLLFATAVFALHQDTMRAYGIDMARADDPGQAPAIDAAQPTPLGGFSARVDLAMDALLVIERANGEILAHPPAGKESEVLLLELLLTRMRASAARLWLLTMQARAGGDGGAGLRLAVAGMWTRLQTVPRLAVAERAAIFTGMYFENIRSERPEFSAWPLSP